MRRSERKRIRFEGATAKIVTIKEQPVPPEKPKPLTPSLVGNVEPLRGPWAKPLDVLIRFSGHVCATFVGYFLAAKDGDEVAYDRLLDVYALVVHNARKNPHELTTADKRVVCAMAVLVTILESKFQKENK